MKKYNVLLIMADQLRYDCLGCNGNNIIKTPNIDRLAETGVNFNSFFVQSPVCVPSRQSFFSGLYPRFHKNRVNYTQMDASLTLMQEYFRRENYNTSFAGKLHYYPPTLEYALTTGFDEGFLHDAGPVDEYSDYCRTLDPKTLEKGYRSCVKGAKNPYTSVLPEDKHETTWCGDTTVGLIREAAKQKEPFFIFSSYWRPHAPFEVPLPWADMYNDCDIETAAPVSRDYLESLPDALHMFAARDDYSVTKEDLLWQNRSYYAAVSQVDAQVGRMLDELESSGLRENTIVVFCSDHGDMLMEHGMRDKNVFFDNSVHVPFIISCPSLFPAAKTDVFAESTDLLPTLFELCGIRIPEIVQGISHFPVLTGQGDYVPREYVFAENIIPEVINTHNLTYEYKRGEGINGIRHPDAKMLRTRDFKYNYYCCDEELYDLRSDPDEWINLAYNPAYAEVKADMKNLLLKHMITADEHMQIAPCWHLTRGADGSWTKYIDSSIY